jgi:phosphomannomutase/phosphoglucomutase
MLPSEIFKAYDIRGVVDKSLSEDVVTRIGQALGTEALALGQDAIIIGRDGRLSGPRLVAALSDGVMAAGCNVIDIGMAPTPAIYFATFHLGTQSAVAVTGSHNPPEYNGLKIVLNGETLAGERIQAVRQRIENGDLATGAGTHRQLEILDDYIDRIVNDVKPSRAMKIVIDCGNGVGGAVAPRLYRELGCEIVELFCEVDGNFPNHHPDPSQPANLKDLVEALKLHDAEIGLAFDGDADRLGVVTPDGNTIWPDRQMILFARDILKRQPGGKVIYDVKCSRNLPLEISAAGGEPVMWRTGHSFIKAKLRESGAVLAGEMSGHIFFKERWFGFDDGLYTGARLIELLSKQDKTPQQVFDELPDSINTPELHIEMEEGEHYRLMEELRANAQFPTGKVSKIDGLRVDFEDGFGLVRPSNTTPLLVLRFEADNEAALSRIKDQFRELILTTRPETPLPF